ncbi:hypothetical protein DVH24_002295 [Malus domestica]|uniref:Uncharacterized protein n=1 Tax=Malus domestica TaxID=3750 RepID=A0A498I9V7_MALDO|nr:hypothetical protein DVH24_002295 [Malus domestica]
MVRVRNKEEEIAFLANCNHLLNGCKVWGKDNHYIRLCNLTHSLIHIVYCFERLNDWYKVELDISEYLILYTMRRSTNTRYYFQSRFNL